jgi:FkbM family methyltransferase
MDIFTPYRLIRAAFSEEGRNSYRAAWRLRVWERAGTDAILHCRLLDRLAMEVATNDQSISKSVFVEGAYEKQELELIQRIVQPGMVVADIGANIGVHALTLADRVGPFGRVHAFEPTRVFDRLSRNIELNGFSSRCMLNKCALGDRAGRLDLADCPPGHEAYVSAGAPLAKGLASGDLLSVPMETLDAYCSRCAIPRFDFVKIDVEGSEVMVLRGAEDLLARNAIGLMMVEFNETCLQNVGSSGNELFHLLTGCGFSLRLLDRPSARLLPCAQPPLGDWDTVMAYGQGVEAIAGI